MASIFWTTFEGRYLHVQNLISSPSYLLPHWPRNHHSFQGPQLKFLLPPWLSLCFPLCPHLCLLSKQQGGPTLNIIQVKLLHPSPEWRWLSIPREMPQTLNVPLCLFCCPLSFQLTLLQPSWPVFQISTILSVLPLQGCFHSRYAYPPPPGSAPTVAWLPYLLHSFFSLKRKKNKTVIPNFKTR